MPQQVRMRKQAASLDFSANNRVSEPLARGFLYRELYLRLTGQLTVSIANNTAAKTLRGDEWALIRKVELIANGTDVIKSIDGNALWWLNFFKYGAAPKTTALLADGATANPAFDSVLILPIWMPRSVKPLDTALDSSKLSSLEIVITFGDHTSINASATGFTTTPRVDVSSLESFNPGGNLTTSSWRNFTIEKEITASNSRFQVQLPVGKMFRSFMINTTDAGVDQGDIMTNLKLISGTTVFADLSCGDDVLHQVSRLRTGTLQSVSRRGTPNDNAGWYHLDLVTDGFLTEAIDTLGFSEFLLEADVTVGGGSTKMVIYPDEIVPVRGNVNG